MEAGILLRCVNLPELVVAGEICEDVWVMDPPSISHARAGATVIVNCSASSETAGKHVYREIPHCRTVGQTWCCGLYSAPMQERENPPRTWYSAAMI